MDKDEIIALAKQAHYFTDLLIKQCDSWLPEEEGIRNVEQTIRERVKKKRKQGNFQSLLRGIKKILF